MPTPIQVAGVNSAESLKTQAPDFLPKMWQQGADLAEQQEDLFSEFEGVSANSAVQIKRELEKDKGDTVVLREIEGLYTDGAVGDETAGDKAEQMRIGAFPIALDYVRKAAERSKRTDTFTALASELGSYTNVNLGRWMGRKKTKHLLKMYQHKGNGENYLFANNKPNREALRSGDVISWDGIVSWAQIMKTAGGRPALVGRGRNKVARYIVCAPGEGLVALKTSGKYQDFLKDAGTSGPENKLFAGDYVDVDGNIIREFNFQDHAGFGPVGSPMNPRAKLGNAIVAGTTTFEITGGGSALAAAVNNAMYFEDFSNYRYKWTTADIAPLDSTDRYVLIYNTSGENAGKWGFYKYVVNDGRKLVVTQRLAAAASGIAATTVGGVIWSAAVNTDVHPEGSIILETNSLGLTFGRTLVLGARGAGRAYGKWNNSRTSDALDGGHFMKTYISSVFGQAPIKRADGSMPHFRVIEHALTYQGLNLPVVT
ncbi:DUF4043 family protein [Opitutaceae bacterium TAV4]|nr:DUF4043 family protein [Opitutaceae bacterium TAV4]RRK02334.1 DUF4043 family protein [Opitutaceae bacterium TAV3]